MSKLKVVFINNTSWGKKYEEKEFKKGFVLNYLLPHNLVLFANKKNIYCLQQKQNFEKQTNLVEESRILEICQEINNLTLEFILNKDKNNKCYGSVNYKDIIQKLSNYNISISKSQLVSFNSLNELGEKIVPIHLGENALANLKVIIK